MTDAGWLWPSVRAALDDALALILPVTCAGCGEQDIALCGACARTLAPAPARREEEVPVWSGLVFDGEVARVVRALKEDGRTSLAARLAPALRAAHTAALAAAPVPSDDIVTVPLPTSRAAFRRRGFRVVELIAHRARVPCVRLLRPARATADQRGLSRAARARNVAYSMVARDAVGLRVVIIDDVVTTGATLREAVRALRAAGAEVIGAATVAATPRRSTRG